MQRTETEIRKAKRNKAKCLKIIAFDSLSGIVSESYKKNDYEKCALGYQALFDFYDREGGFDSLKKDETPRLNMCIEKMYSENPSYETFKKIDEMKYSDKSYVEKLRAKIETGFEEKLLSLSSNMNIDSLFAFRKNYPGIYTNDVGSLIEKVKDKYKLTVLRNISPAAVKVYYEYFGGPDDEIESKLEVVMFSKFCKEYSKESAENYLYRFPKGKHVDNVNAYMRMQANATQNGNY